MKQDLTLNDLAPTESAFVKDLLCTGSIRRRLMDIGLIKRTLVTCVGESPAGDPKAFLIRGAVIAIRGKDSRNILIQDKEQMHGKHQNHRHSRQPQCRKEHPF